MGGQPAREVDADRGDLAPPHPDADPLALAGGGHDAVVGEQRDQRRRQVPDVAAQVAAVGRQVEDGVADELAGAVVGDLAAAVGLDHFDAAPRPLGRRQQDVGLGCVAPERVDMGVLEQQQPLGPVAVAQGLARLDLQLEGARILDAPEPAPVRASAPAGHGAILVARPVTIRGLRRRGQSVGPRPREPEERRCRTARFGSSSATTTATSTPPRWCDAAEGYEQHLDGRRQDDGHPGRRDEHRRARALAGRDDPPGQGPRHQLHRRQPRGGHLQPGGARPLRARPQLPRPHPRGGARAARPPPQPRHRHLHPRGRGDAPHRARRARGVAGGRRARRALLPARVPLPHPALAASSTAVLPDRPQGQLDAGRRREEPADLRAGLGGLHARQHLRRRTASRATSRTSTPCAPASST